MRFSTGVAHSMTPLTGGSYSIACKALIDGRHSANIFGMYSTDGQPEYNPFERDFSNVVP